MTTTVITPLNAVKATTTSVAISTDGLEKASFIFTRADHSSGSSKFEILGSLDGVTFTAVMMVQDVANTNSETLLRGVDTTLGGNGSEIWHLDNFVAYKSIKIKVTETTDGTHTAVMCLMVNDVD